MRILADANVPREYVTAFRGDGHEVAYSRDVDELGPSATDAAIVEFAERAEYALLSTDLKDFADVEATVPVFVAPQDMNDGAVRTAVAEVESLSFDPARASPIWLSAL